MLVMENKHRKPWILGDIMASNDVTPNKAKWQCGPSQKGNKPMKWDSSLVTLYKCCINSLVSELDLDKDMWDVSHLH